MDDDLRRAEEALFRRAVGFGYTETRVESAEGGAKTAVTEKYAEPDVRALLFWLCNRFPERWRDRPEPGGEDPLAALRELAAANRAAAAAAAVAMGEPDEIANASRDADHAIQ